MWLIKDEDGTTVKFCYSQSEAQAWVAQRPDWPLTISWVEMP